jgi:hypothetical protein
LARVARTTRRSPELVWLLTGPLAVVLLAVTTFIGLDSKPAVGEWALAGLLFCLLILAELFRLSFEVRRQMVVLTLFEIPFLLGLNYLPPVTFIVTVVLAAAVKEARRKLAPVKSAYNVAINGAQAVSATLVWVSFRPINPEDPSAWLVLAIAVSVATLISLVGVIGVITLVQGMIPPKQIMSIAVPGQLMTGVNTAIALVVLIVLQRSYWAFAVIAVLLVFSILAYRSYTQSLRQHRTLTELYALTRAISERWLC